MKLHQNCLCESRCAAGPTGMSVQAGPAHSLLTARQPWQRRTQDRVVAAQGWFDRWSKPKQMTVAIAGVLWSQLRQLHVEPEHSRNAAVVAGTHLRTFATSTTRPATSY